MRVLFFLYLALFFASCTLTDRGVRVDFPKAETNVCLNAVSNEELIAMKSKIENETFAAEKLKRAKFHARNRCFSTSQVLLMMGAFTFANDQLEMAKYLYTKTDDKYNYDVVIDELTYNRDKDELRNYIDSI